MGIFNKYFKAGSNSSENTSAEDYYHIGVQAGISGDELQALEAYNLAIQLNPHFKEALFNRGNTFYRLNKYFEAISDFDKVIKIDPKFAGAIYNRGATKLHLGNINEAKNDFIQASKLGDINAVNALKEYELRYGKVEPQYNGFHFKPDYRDVILYNGYIPYRANGNFMGDLIEFEKYNNPESKIVFNTNLTKQAYINNHDKFDLVRNRDGKSFATFQMMMAQGNFIPTGRTFMNETHGITWEHMKLDDPCTVLYFKFPINENFVTGQKCLEIVLK